MKTSAPTTWMPLDIGAYLADTMDLAPDEHGCYLLMIMHYWKNRGPISVDRLSFQRITKCDNRNAKKLYARVSEFFTIENGKWIHKRIDEELNKAIEYKEKRRNQTAAATAARWGKTDSVTDTQTEYVTDRPLPLPLPSSVTNVTSDIKNSEDKSSSFSLEPYKPEKEKINFDFDSITFSGISDLQKSKWAEAYPAIDIEKQIAAAGAWLQANPKQRKSNYAKFLVNWFSRAQDKAPRVGPGRAPPQSFEMQRKQQTDLAIEEARKRYV